MTLRFKHVCKETTRHGKVMYYYRIGSRRIRLPDDYGSETFAAAVRLAATVGAASLERKPNNAVTRNRSKVGRALSAAIKGAKKRAQAKSVPFDLDLEWALEQAEAQNLRCALTGIPFYFEIDTRSKRGHMPFAPSLDRIKAGQGYTKANVRIVIYAINVMLFDWGPGVFERVVSGYRFTSGTKTKQLRPHLSGIGPHLKLN